MGERDGGQPVGAEREVRIAEGVSIRYYAGKPESIRIAFQFRGEECRERLRLEPTAPNQRYAVRLRGEIINAIGRGTFDYAAFFPESSRARRLGFAPKDRLVSALLDEHEVISRPTVSASTWMGYSKIMATYLRPWFGATRVRDLTPAVIREKLLASGLSLKTARNIVSVLNVPLERAVGDGELETNPLDRVKLKLIWPKDRRITDWEVDPFSFDEMTAIFGACRDEEEADYWRAAFGTGMRTSEQIILPWSHVNLVALGGVRIELAEVRGLNGMVEKDPKTQAGKRVIPFTAGALEAFQRQYERTGGAAARAFRDTRYMQPWRGEQPLRKRWARILGKAGVRYRNPYQTRHTFASVLLAAGRSPLQVAKWMGHETVEMQQRHYARWIEQGSSPETRAALAAFFHVAGGGSATVLRIA